MTLYRKYRPKTFAELIGQNHIKITLLNEIETGQITHAYLFCGPQAVGKTTTARLFAKAVNCLETSTPEPCNRCSSCQEINQARSLDLVEIDAASNRGINEIRELKDHIRHVPAKSKFKVFIIDEVHMLTPEAFNALLKTLEEPPLHAIFILATTQVSKLPETIISRCQRFDFKKVDSNLIKGRLKIISQQEGVEIDEDILEVISLKSQGCPRDAESLLSQVLSLGDKKITWNEASLILPTSHINLVKKFTSYLIKKDTAEALKLTNELVQEGIDLEEFTEGLIEFLRKLLWIKIGLELQELPFGILDEEFKEISLLKELVSLKEIQKMLQVFLEEKKEMKRGSAITQIPLEMGVVEICLEEK